MDNTDKYSCDFILPIGEACRPAASIRDVGLRGFSAPLDWMMDYSLDTVIHLFRTGFSDFFTEYELDSEEPVISEIGTFKVHDTKNSITSLHDFPEDEPLYVSYPKFKEKMNRRIERLEYNLLNASSIILLSNRDDSEKELSDFLKSFSSIYPNLTIRLVNFRNNDKLSHDTYEKRIIFENNKLSYVEYILNDTSTGKIKWIGNKDMWSLILSKYTKSCVIKKGE